jgi:hypothetical protein
VWTYGGGADFYFTSNLNNPYSARNVLRTFDLHDGGGIHLNLVQAWVERARTPVGFRLDLHWGPAARLQNLSEASDNDVWEHIQEAYVSANLTGDGSTYLDFGKWITPAGLEVVEVQDNILYSHSALFYATTPYFHFGPRLFHYFNETDYVTLSIHRGWNTVVDPGHAPGFGVSVGKALSSELEATATYIGGDELDDFGRAGWRSLVDAILEYEPDDRWSYQLNASFAAQSDVKVRRDRRGANAAWYGVAGMVKRSLDPERSLGGRLEWVRDDSGFMLGETMSLVSLTLNFTRHFGPHFETRLEFRQDVAVGARPFRGANPEETHSTQATFTVAGIVSF